MEWIIEDSANGKRIVDYLREEKSFSRRIVKAIKFDGGEIFVNGCQCTVGDRLTVGDTLSITFPPEKKGNLKASPIQLNIVYEDDAVLIIDKQAGVTTIPSLYHSNDSIANGILAHYEKYHIPYTVHIVTRLDRDTSGLLLVAKHRYSHSLLAASQKARKINRTYTALTEGILTKKIGTIDAKIGRKADSIIERTVCLDGQQAITHYEVLEEKEQLSVVRVSLETGRTHQIRVHFSWLGHPLIGDDLYGGSQALLNRQALHCSQLSFIHPFTNREMVFHSTLPKDMQRLIQNQ